MKSSRRTVVIRYTANALLLIGQSFVLYREDMSIGLIIKIIGGLTLLTTFISYRMWDMITVLVAFFVLDLSKLLHIIINK